MIIITHALCEVKHKNSHLHIHSLSKPISLSFVKRHVKIYIKRPVDHSYCLIYKTFYIKTCYAKINYNGNIIKLTQYYGRCHKNGACENTEKYIT